MIDTRIDAPFLTKFNRKSPYLKPNELIDSITDEIGNILASKTALSPFLYGVPDLQSLDNSPESLNTFAEHCRKAVLRFEPRVRDVEISNCHINTNTQSLELEISCFVPTLNQKLKTQINLPN